MTSHVPEWAMYPARLAMTWTWTCSSTRMPNNTFVHCVHYAVDNSAEHCQKCDKKNSTCKRIASCSPQYGRCCALTSWPIVSRAHFISGILLLWVSNASKHKHMVLYRVVSWAGRPFARIVIANGSLFLWETFLLHLFLCFLWSASCMTYNHKLLALSI